MQAGQSIGAPYMGQRPGPGLVRSTRLPQRLTASPLHSMGTAVGVDKPQKLVLVVGVALIDAKRAVDKVPRVLLAQRPAGKANAGLWEFPGGKVEPKETPEAALARELQEELGLQVSLRALGQPAKLLGKAGHPSLCILPGGVYMAPTAYTACFEWRGTAHGVEGQQLVMATAEQLQADFPLTPADVPLIPAVLRAMREAREGTRD